MLKVIKNRIEFNVTSDDLIPFYPIMEKDFSLYVASNKLNDIDFRYSRISYRG